LDDITGQERLPKESTDAVVVGCGLGGLISAIALDEVNADMVLFDKSAHVGGVWRHTGNPHSRVNSSEPGYRIRVSRKAQSTNHEFQHEMIDDIYHAVLQHNLAQRIFLRTEIYSVRSGVDGGWRVAGISRVAGDFVVSGKIVALCTSRRLGAPRNIQYPGEDRYKHFVCRGLAGDNVAAPWKGAQVLILGMGAFAVEQIRTGVEHGAARVRILCRRHGLVCPQMIDYMN
jgi:cation diffusion facilitator CzcD-associated flavoprotein CzcO